MQIQSRKVLIEFIWLTVILGVTLLLSVLLLGTRIFGGTIDIYLYDTYFVIIPEYILIPIFLTLTFITYFIKEFRNSFRRVLPNLTLILTGLMLIIALTFLIQRFSQVFTRGWTAYPPFSVLTPEIVPELSQDPVIIAITNFFIIIQVVVLIMLLYVGFRWRTKNM